MEKAPLSPVTGKPMVRDIRHFNVQVDGHSITVPVPGWYCEDSDESIHVGDDLSVLDDVIERWESGMMLDVWVKNENEPSTKGK